MYGYVSNSNHFTGKKSFKTNKKKKKIKVQKSHENKYEKLAKQKKVILYENQIEEHIND